MKIHGLCLRMFALGLAVVALGALHDARAAETTRPHLTHSAPMLGRILELRVEGAPVGAEVRFLSAESAGTSATPFGTLELDRASVELVGVRTASAFGTASLWLPLPIQPALAEREGHFQAVVLHRTLPDGGLLSDAAHLRVLGPRVYASFRGEGPTPGGLTVFDAQFHSALFTVPWSAANEAEGEVGDGAPVFDRFLTRGAVMASPSECVVFDPYFGERLASIPCENASRTLLRCNCAAGRHAFVIERGVGDHGRLLVVDLVLARVVSGIDLPFEASGHVAVDADHTMAFLGEYLPATHQTAVRLFDLTNLGFSGNVAVGGRRSTTLRDLTWCSGQVFAATGTVYDGIDHYGKLSRVDLRVYPPEVTTNSYFMVTVDELTPLERSCTLLFSQYQDYVPADELVGTRLMHPGAEFSMGAPWVYLRVNELLPDAEGTGVWVLDRAGNEPPNGDDPARLYHLAVDGAVWTQVPHEWHLTGPVDVDLAHDALVHRVYAAVPGLAPPIDIAPEVCAVDVADGTLHHLPIGPNPEGVHAVSIEPVVHP